MAAMFGLLVKYVAPVGLRELLLRNKEVICKKKKKRKKKEKKIEASKHVGNVTNKYISKGKFNTVKV